MIIKKFKENNEELKLLEVTGSDETGCINIIAKNGYYIINLIKIRSNKLL